MDTTKSNTRGKEMAIINLFDLNETSTLKEEVVADQLELPGFEVPLEEEEKSSLFSAVAARFLFFLLLLADILWGVYSWVMLFVKLTLNMVTFFRVERLRESLDYTWLAVRRSLVCGLALFVALFSPALGIMFSCMYFLMYDSSGIDEIVPESLRDQVKSFFPA
ncbi:MAG: hypothetical protein MRY21_05530 [Simkaniaceae bacterium]|nr:hypothetical protein [Simkaniaceae bacterium]